ncbi:MAG: response regulator [Desulfobacterales bacterium]
MIFCRRPQPGTEPFLPATFKIHQKALKGIYRMFKILIIDPNTPFRKSLVKSLSSQFPAAELRGAATGEDGLKQMDTFAPHLIFMDFYLPDISGLDLAKKIRASHSEIILAIFVHYDSPEYQAAANECGVVHLIPKDDWAVKDILALVESVISDTGLSQLQKSGNGN